MPTKLFYKIFLILLFCSMQSHSSPTTSVYFDSQDFIFKAPCDHYREICLHPKKEWDGEQVMFVFSLIKSPKKALLQKKIQLISSPLPLGIHCDDAGKSDHAYYRLECFHDDKKVAASDIFDYTIHNDKKTSSEATFDISQLAMPPFYLVAPSSDSHSKYLYFIATLLLISSAWLIPKVQAYIKKPTYYDNLQKEISELTQALSKGNDLLRNGNTNIHFSMRAVQTILGYKLREKLVRDEQDFDAQKKQRLSELRSDLQKHISNFHKKQHVIRAHIYANMARYASIPTVINNTPPTPKDEEERLCCIDVAQIAGRIKATLYTLAKTKGGEPEKNKSSWQNRAALEEILGLLLENNLYNWLYCCHFELIDSTGQHYTGFDWFERYFNDVVSSGFETTLNAYNNPLCL